MDYRRILQTHIIDAYYRRILQTHIIDANYRRNLQTHIIDVYYRRILQMHIIDAYIHIYIYILYKYITQLAQKIMGTKFVIHPAGALPPARTLITNSVLSLFSGLDILYIYIIYGRVVGEVSRWMVLKILNHGSNETLPYIYIYI